MYRSICMALALGACRGMPPADCVPLEFDTAMPRQDVDPYAVCVDLDYGYQAADGRTGLDAHAEDTLDLWRQAGLLHAGKVVEVDTTIPAYDRVQVEVLPQRTLCVFQPLCR